MSDMKAAAIEKAVASICDFAGLSPTGQYANYIRCALSQAIEEATNGIAADDDLPITDDWLRGVGFEKSKHGPTRWWSDSFTLKPAAKDGTWACWHYTEASDRQSCLVVLLNRGDLRRLAVALGIPLPGEEVLAEHLVLSHAQPAAQPSQPSLMAQVVGSTYGNIIDGVRSPPPTSPQSIADATAKLRAERDRLRSQLESVQGALADAGSVLAERLDGDYAASVRELTQERDELSKTLAEAKAENIALVKQWNDLDQRNEANHREWSAKLAEAERARDKLTLQSRIGPCDVCWTNSWSPADSSEPDAVHLKDGTYARCDMCWLTKQIRAVQQRAHQAEQRERELAGQVLALAARTPDKVELLIRMDRIRELLNTTFSAPTPSEVKP